MRAAVHASGGTDKEHADAIQSPENERRCPEPLLRQEILRLRAQDDEGEGLAITGENGLRVTARELATMTEDDSTPKDEG